MSAAEDEYFDPKKENLSYTIAIIKPHVCISNENVNTYVIIRFNLFSQL